MIKILKLILFFYFSINILNTSVGSQEYFRKGLELYKDKKYDALKQIEIYGENQEWMKLDQYSNSVAPFI